MDLLLGANRIDDALLVLKTCHKLDPYNGQINDWIDQLEHSKNSAEASRSANSWPRFNAPSTPNKPAARQMLDQASALSGGRSEHDAAARPAMYLRIGEMDKTEEAFQRVIQLAPESSEPWYNLALVQANRGETAEAVASLKKVFALNAAEIKQDPKALNLVEHLYQDPGFGRLRQTPNSRPRFRQSRNSFHRRGEVLQIRHPVAQGREAVHHRRSGDDPQVFQVSPGGAAPVNAVAPLGMGHVGAARRG